MIKKIYCLLFLLIFSSASFAGVKFYEARQSLIIYNGTDSPVLVKLYDIDNTVLTDTEISAITKIEIKYIPATGSTVERVNSVDYVAGFDFGTERASGEILTNLGLYGFTAGRDKKAEMLLYNSTYTSGAVIGIFDMQVLEDVNGSPTLKTTI
jgi:hypothetical protein